MWEPIAGPDAVQTPAEVYAALAAEGLGVRYLRVPVTDGKAPSAGDIDAIMRQVGCVVSILLCADCGAVMTILARSAVAGSAATACRTWFVGKSVSSCRGSCILPFFSVSVISLV
jgi:hypothetical protein